MSGRMGFFSPPPFFFWDRVLLQFWSLSWPGWEWPFSEGWANQVKLVTQTLLSWPHTKTLFYPSPTIHTHLLVILCSRAVLSQEVHITLDCHFSGHTQICASPEPLWVTLLSLQDTMLGVLVPGGNKTCAVTHQYQVSGESKANVFPWVLNQAKKSFPFL